MVEAGEWDMEGSWEEGTHIPSVGSNLGYREAGGGPEWRHTWLLPIITIDPR